MALVSLCIWADLLEHSVLVNLISTKILSASLNFIIVENLLFCADNTNIFPCFYVLHDRLDTYCLGCGSSRHSFLPTFQTCTDAYLGQPEEMIRSS